MKKNYILMAIVFIFINAIAQRNPEFQDPADWIPLKQSFAPVSTSIVPKPGQLPEMYSAPIEYVSEIENDVFPLNFRTRFLKFGYTEEAEERVQFWGVVDLSCCKNKPATVELFDNDGNLIQAGRTDENGNIKFMSPNGKLLEFDNYRVKINIKKIRVISEELNKKEVVFKWINKPSEKELKKLRKKAMRKYKERINYLEELRNKY